MDVCTNYIKTALNRRDTYAFLARMYRIEIDQSLLSSMKQLSFENITGDDSFSQGAKLFESYLCSMGFKAKTDLAVDYARVILGIGAPPGKAAYPYESVYTSPDRLIMQDAYDAVFKLFQAKELEVRGRNDVDNYATQALGDNKEPVDHITLELDFMTYLIEEGYRFAQEDNAQVLLDSIHEQQDFLGTHLLNWVPSFCGDVEKYALTDFYKGVGKMTLGYLETDTILLDNLTGGDRGL